MREIPLKAVIYKCRVEPDRWHLLLRRKGTLSAYANKTWDGCVQKLIELAGVQ